MEFLGFFFFFAHPIKIAQPLMDLFHPLSCQSGHTEMCSCSTSWRWGEWVDGRQVLLNSGKLDCAFSSDSYGASFFFSSLSPALVDAKENKEVFG